MDNPIVIKTFIRDMTKIPRYKGDSYYASGILRNIRYNDKKQEMWGEIMVKGTGEWIDTLFLYQSKWIIWE